MTSDTELKERIAAALPCERGLHLKFGHTRDCAASFRSAVLALVEDERKRVIEEAENSFKDAYSEQDDPLIGVMYGLKAIRALIPPSATTSEP